MRVPETGHSSTGESQIGLSVSGDLTETHPTRVGQAGNGPDIEEVPVPRVENVVADSNDDETINLGSFPEKLTPRKLSQIAESKNLDALEELGGIEGILGGLGTDPKGGLSGSLSKGTGSVGFVASLEEQIGRAHV